MSSVPDSVVEPEAWNRELANAFEVLLGRSLGAYSTTAEYAFFTWNDEMSFLMRDDFFTGAIDVNAVARGEPIDDDHHDGVSPFDWDQWPVDHGRSVWLFDEGALGGDGGPGRPIHPALRAVSVAYGSRRVVSGADLARVLAAHGGRLGEVDGPEAIGMVRWLQRIRTDGTLFDAMRAATWTMGGPGDLAAFDDEVEVEPELEEALRRISDPRLRDHLRMLCLTEEWARCDGGYYLGPRECPSDLRWIAEQSGHDVVAGWEFGEGQASSAIFEIT
ncbi:hypothetical protein [Rhizohabitans arisaemae]|uniref:hypothetical protein n=1 Tax=Rhizohabitans arisaemae TaxID=2720610 RepID=UPI0024B0C039|nr:hypothetical protein [Rhizohabitans arisaemae]